MRSLSAIKRGNDVWRPASKLLGIVELIILRRFSLKEIRFHGRGGQGAVMGASMLAYAFVIEGKHAASIPMFGFERRGAPVTASIRFDDQPIRDTHLIYEPDCSVVLDPSFARSPAPIEGLKGDGIMILNTPKEL